MNTNAVICLQYIHKMQFYKLKYTKKGLKINRPSIHAPKCLVRMYSTISRCVRTLARKRERENTPFVKWPLIKRSTYAALR